MASSDWKKQYGSKVVSAVQAISHIRSGSKIFIGTGCAAPQTLIEAMVSESNGLDDASLFHLLTLGLAPYASDQFSKRFRLNSFFISSI